jgi:hypothetical protein
MAGQARGCGHDSEYGEFIVSAFEVEIDELMRGIREEVRRKRKLEVGLNAVAPSVDAKPPLDCSVIDRRSVR